MKHHYALITDLGIEFSQFPYAREHDMGHRPDLGEGGDHHADCDYYAGVDYDEL